MAGPWVGLAVSVFDLGVFAYPKDFERGSNREAGKIIAGNPDRLALAVGAALHPLVAMSIEGKIKGAPLKAIVPETVEHVLKGLSTNKN
jgi:hypothetical protein